MFTVTYNFMTFAGQLFNLFELFDPEQEDTQIFELSVTTSILIKTI